MVCQSIVFIYENPFLRQLPSCVTFLSLLLEAKVEHIADEPGASRTSGRAEAPGFRDLSFFGTCLEVERNSSAAPEEGIGSEDARSKKGNKLSRKTQRVP